PLLVTARCSLPTAHCPLLTVICLPPMLKDLLGRLWRYLPRSVRRRLARLGGRRFTVTAGGLVFDDTGRILLLEHVFRPDKGWGIPGGFLGKGDQPGAA